MPLTTGQVARKLKCSPTMVRKLIRSEALAAYRVGTDWRITPGAVKAYIEKSRRGAKEDK